MIKDVDKICRDVLVASKETHVGVEPGGLNVIVSGRNMGVTFKTVALTADNENCFGVRL